MLIKPMIGKDIKTIKKLQPKGWSNIVETFKYYYKAPFCYPIKAVIEGEIVGIGTAISYINTGWLAHIIVSEEHRGKGIGGAIVNYLCDYLKNSGHKTISLIATELGYPVYKKAGFREQTEYIFLERTELLQYISSDNITLITDRNKEEILSLDKMIAGENRQKLLADFLNNGYVYQKNSTILGYYLKELGEGAISADDIEAGKELIKLRSSFSKTAVLPILNKTGIDFYKSIGFTEKLIVKRMIYGEEISWHSKKIFNRIGGNFG